MTKRVLGKALSVAARRLLTSSAVGLMMGLGLSGAVMTPMMAYAAPGDAAAALTADVIASATASLNAALGPALSASYSTPAAKNAAVAEAISVAMGGLTTANPTISGQLASLVIAASLQAGATSDAVGGGLGKAAAVMSAANPAGARDIAVTVANEGDAVMIEAFAAAVAANGGPASLAQIARTPPDLIGALPANDNAGVTTAAGSRPPPCNNPSCT